MKQLFLSIIFFNYIIISGSDTKKNEPRPIFFRVKKENKHLANPENLYQFIQEAIHWNRNTNIHGYIGSYNDNKTKELKISFFHDSKTKPDNIMFYRDNTDNSPNFTEESIWGDESLDITQTINNIFDTQKETTSNPTKKAHLALMQKISHCTVSSNMSFNPQVHPRIAQQNDVVNESSNTILIPKEPHHLTQRRQREEENTLKDYQETEDKSSQEPPIYNYQNLEIFAFSSLSSFSSSSPSPKDPAKN